MTSQVDLLEIPGVMFSEDYASLGTFFLLFVQIVPAFCLVVILLLVNRVRMPDITENPARACPFPAQKLGDG